MYPTGKAGFSPFFVQKAHPHRAFLRNNTRADRHSKGRRQEVKSLYKINIYLKILSLISLLTIFFYFAPSSPSRHLIPDKILSLFQPLTFLFRFILSVFSRCQQPLENYTKNSPAS